jgi:hypothetical protein
VERTSFLANWPSLFHMSHDERKDIRGKRSKSDFGTHSRNETLRVVRWAYTINLSRSGTISSSGSPALMTPPTLKNLTTVPDTGAAITSRRNTSFARKFDAIGGSGGNIARVRIAHVFTLGHRWGGTKGNEGFHGGKVAVHRPRCAAPTAMNGGRICRCLIDEPLRRSRQTRKYVRAYRGSSDQGGSARRYCASLQAIQNRTPCYPPARRTDESTQKIHLHSWRRRLRHDSFPTPSRSPTHSEQPILGCGIGNSRSRNKRTVVSIGVPPWIHFGGAGVR